ncbi:Triosephosphate isomerase [Moorella glycerini]|uniref:Triosephosphate isomerase n=1 Tax=Neomoorella stamsii TaxID=1266720 RepID=A0A9X7J5B5_9FIRM|nr:MULTISPECIES: triose-phosphate isomerase family protein [Moorella]PRR77556.1 Triosephosphate isomerase [Moorella stamsii]CEP69397.1 Triosephosphate isomerase [Moorella glycerini]
MKEIFVNLKRFEVPKNLGGICPLDNPIKWIEWVMEESVTYGLGKLPDIRVTYLLPEALIISALAKLASYSAGEVQNLQIGCQGVFREDVTPGGNFGAFTTNLPAAAAKNLGCTWTIIGHSEERRDKLGIIERYDPSYNDSETARTKAMHALNSIINEEVICALRAGLNVLLCVGETAVERGDGSFAEQKPRIEAVLRSQLEMGLQGIEGKTGDNKIVIGYEPVWAIGPGKTPPGREYISFVSATIKAIVKERFNFDPVVVYGGGLKEENAKMIAEIETIGGGLVALTRFTGDIGFEPEGLKNIIAKYVA